jgi:hypothetical protein
VHIVNDDPVRIGRGNLGDHQRAGHIG